jgi:hypothetical protein
VSGHLFFNAYPPTYVKGHAKIVAYPPWYLGGHATIGIRVESFLITNIELEKRKMKNGGY